ncbi:unnamed protein product [Parnassius apollo]|uniref:(apollo) hypothetical protein n=1 Tax=Parnassius apollo TaxID=110799 RepID=A0A8S3X8J4_PARAO|nr:unnamed protein product [Parnassius apollo]
MNNSTEQIFLVNSPGNQSVIGPLKISENTTSQVNLENVENFSNVCRTCATITEFVIPIFMGEGLQNNLAEKIHKHLPIQVSEQDVLPRVVCYQCASTLLAWHELVQCCVQADKALKTRLAVMQHKQKSSKHEARGNLHKESQAKSRKSVCVSSIKKVLIEYFKLSDEDLDHSGLEIICEKCNNESSFQTLQSFVEHLKLQHNFEITDKKSVENFIKEYVSIVEMLVAEDQIADLESEKGMVDIKIPRFYCPFCESAFSSTTRLFCHLNQHVDVCIEEGVTCCDNVYKDTKSFAVHLQEQHVNHPPNAANICQSCGFIAEDSQHLQSHVSKEHYVEKFDVNYVKERLENHDRWTPSRVNFDAYLSRVEAKTELKNNTIKVQNFNAVSAVDETVEMDDGSDDDQPLATIATKKSTDLYKKFYDALVSFRNHFVTEHKETKCEYPDFTDSSDSEEIMDDQSEDEDKNVNKFDDLTKCNMRIDKMNDETRLELNEVQRKINGKVFFTCKICDKNLSSAHTYIFHKRIHTGERPCVCHICGKQFRAPNGLQRHLTETHERLRRYACSFCPKNFANTQNLKQHIRIHTGERPFVCTHCGKRFTQSGSLHVHLKTHSEQFPFHCAECGAKFRLRAGLTRHRLKHSGERPHVCVQCGKGFRHKHDLFSHALSHTDPKPHTCSVCNAAFRQKRALKHHYKRVHENEPPREVVNHLVFNNLGQYHPILNECEVKVERSSEFESDSTHVEKQKDITETINKSLTIVNEDGKKYAHCGICEKNVSVGSWKRHVRSHVGEKRYSCHTCGLSFNDSGNLARHRRALHAKHRPFSCHICNKAFTRSSHLQDHVKSHSQSRDYVCDICGKASKSGAALRMHKKIHEDQFKFQCMECDSKFKRRGELKAHLTIHTGEKAHSCWFKDLNEFVAQTMGSTQYANSSNSLSKLGKTCEYCGIKQSDDLYTDHLITMHSESLFHCNECDTYLDRKDFILHMSIHVQYVANSDKKEALKKLRKRKSNKDKNENAVITTLKSNPSQNKETVEKTIKNCPRENSNNETPENEFSDHSDVEYFGRLPESVFEAIEDSQDSQCDNDPELPQTSENNELNENNDNSDISNECIKISKDLTPTARPASDSKTEKRHKKTRTCPICSKVYTASSSYFYHLKNSHQQSKDYECDVCGKRLGNKSSLAQHASIHVSERRLECRQCGKKFRSKASLYIHEQIHSNVKTWACNQCNRSFRWRTHLLRHLKRHSAEKSHICTSCGRGFKIHCDLLRHARTHTAGNFSCEKCGVKFAQHRYLKVHMIKKHSNKITGNESQN